MKHLLLLALIALCSCTRNDIPIKPNKLGTEYIYYVDVRSDALDSIDRLLIYYDADSVDCAFTEREGLPLSVTYRQDTIAFISGIIGVLGKERAICDYDYFITNVLYKEKRGCTSLRNPFDNFN